MAVDCGRQHTREGIEFLVPYWLCVIKQTFPTEGPE